MAETVDVVVIGMGPGGEDVAGQLAQAGLYVVGIDSAAGGRRMPVLRLHPQQDDHPWRRRAAEGRRLPQVGGDATVRPDFAPVAERIRKEATDNWDDKAAVERFTGKGGRFIRGRGGSPARTP